MTFKEYIQFSEQGTSSFPGGLQAAGRLGQGMKPERMSMGDLPSTKGTGQPATSKKRSPFAASSQGTVNPKPEFGSMNAGGVKGVKPNQPSPLSPRGLSTGRNKNINTTLS